MEQPVFEKISYNRKLDKIKEQVKVEIKTDVVSSDVSSVLSIWAWANANESRLANGTAEFGGKTNFYLSYTHENGEIKKYECASDFSGAVKDPAFTDICKSITTVMVEKTEADTSGAYLTLIAHLTVCIDISACESVDALISGENLVVNQGEFDCVKSFGLRKGAYPIEEEFELSYPVKEVLFHRADGVITAVQSGVGCIIVDGQVLLSLVLLQNNDKNDIIKENRAIPFRMEIECEEAMPNMQATASVYERSLKTDVSVDVEKNKSVVSASVNLSFTGEAFSIEQTSCAIDAFSTKNQIKIEKQKVPFYTACELRSHNAVVGERAGVNELPVGATVLATLCEKANVIEKQCQDGNVKICGTVSATAFLRDGDGKVFTRKLEIPFEKSFDGGYDCDMLLSVQIKAVNARAKVVSLTEIELESELFVTVCPCKKFETEVIKQIDILEPKTECESAITVYIAEEGEDMWSLAKRLNVCPEALSATNKDLQFPLTGEERIIIYRKK